MKKIKKKQTASLLLIIVFSFTGCLCIPPQATSAECSHSTDMAINSVETVPKDSSASFETIPVISGNVAIEPAETTFPEMSPVETTLPETEHPITETPVAAPPTTVPQETEPPATEPPHEHSYSVSNTVAPSCESQGYTTYVCSCGASYSDNYTAALGHSYSSTVVAATTESEGYTEHVCSQCGSSYRDSYTEKLPASVVTLNYAAAEAYGNQYAANAYGWLIDTSLNSGNAGYYPGTNCRVEGVIEKGGQDYLNRCVAGMVDALNSNLSLYGSTKGCSVNCDVYENGDGIIWIVVYYG